MTNDHTIGTRLPEGRRALLVCHSRGPRPWPVFVLSLLLALSFLSTRLASDTIVLKNGRRITAEAVTEDGGKVLYESDGGQISLPKSLVERIEKDDTRPPQTSRAAATKSPGEAFVKGLSIQIQAPRKDVEGIIRNNAVDEDRLAATASLAGKGDLERETAVYAYLIAAAFEGRQQRTGQASKWAEEALHLSGQNPDALLIAAQLDLMRQQYSEALRHLLLAQSLRPDSPDVLTLLGYAYYFLEGPEKANRYWRQSYALRADAKIEDLIRQTEKEEKVEGGFTQAESSHFVLSREGSEISDSFSREIMEALEQDYRDLESALDFAPRDSIAVILYPAQQFADITRVPGWVGALNDGKIRVPVRGLSSMTGELGKVLKHEMVHSFVHRLAQGRCPTWFNEGLAQVESGENSLVSSVLLPRLYAESRQIPLSQLEGSFLQLDSTLAAVAYAESQAAVAMIRDQYGAYQLPQLLKALADGNSMAEALKKILRLDYPQLEAELASRLAQR